MNILAIVGSPRKGQATDLLIDKIIEGFHSKSNPTESQVKKIYLIDYNINHCTNCLSCRDSNSQEDVAECTLEDDMNQLNKIIVDSDFIIAGTPLHMGYTTSLFSTFLGRICWTFAKPTGKFLNVSGIPQPRSAKKRKSVIITTNALVPPVYKMFADHATPLIKETFKHSLNCKNIGTLFAGDIENRGLKAYSEKAIKLGRKINL